MKVYFVSGLAADSRVFKYIRLPSNCQAVHLDWIEPLINESLTNYSLRLAEKIDSSMPFGVIGFSMGGMIASEIMQKLKPVITIFISSVPSPRYLPFYFKIIGKFNLHKIVPMYVLKSGARIKHFISIKTNQDRALLNQMVKDTNDRFMGWAVHAILTWKDVSELSNYIHIHGSHDETLPIAFTRPTHIIKKAGHLLVITNASEVNKILEDALSAFRV